jgi:hypothetical protein
MTIPTAASLVETSVPQANQTPREARSAKLSTSSGSAPDKRMPRDLVSHSLSPSSEHAMALRSAPEKSPRLLMSATRSSLDGPTGNSRFYKILPPLQRRELRESMTETARSRGERWTLSEEVIQCIPKELCKRSTIMSRAKPWPSNSNMTSP